MKRLNPNQINRDILEGCFTGPQSHIEDPESNEPIKTIRENNSYYKIQYQPYLSQNCYTRKQVYYVITNNPNGIHSIMDSNNRFVSEKKYKELITKDNSIKSYLTPYYTLKRMGDKYVYTEITPWDD